MFKRKTSEGSLPERRLSLLLSHRLPGKIITQGTTTSSFPLSSSQLQKNKINTIINSNNNPRTQISPDITFSPAPQEKAHRQEENTLSSHAFPQRNNRITSLSLKEGYYFKTIPQIDKNNYSSQKVYVETAPFAQSSSNSSQQYQNTLISLNQPQQNQQIAAFLSSTPSQKQISQIQLQFQKKSGEVRKENTHITLKQLNTINNNQHINTINPQSTQASFNYPQTYQEVSLKLDFGSSRRKNTQTKSLSSMAAADSRLQLNDFKNYLRESENYQRLPKACNKQQQKQLSFLQDFISSNPQHCKSQPSCQNVGLQEPNNPSQFLRSFYSGKSNQLKSILNPNISNAGNETSTSHYPVIISHLSPQNPFQRNAIFQAVKTQNNSNNNNEDYFEENIYQYQPHRTVSMSQRKSTHGTPSQSAKKFLNSISKEGQLWKTIDNTNKKSSTKQSQTHENQENNQQSLFSMDKFKLNQIERTEDFFDKYDLEPWQSSLPRDQTESFLVQGDEETDLNYDNNNSYNLLSQS